VLPYRSRLSLVAAALLIAFLLVVFGLEAADSSVFTDYRSQQPGVFHKITPQDLPPPWATKSVGNYPSIVPRPANAWPQAPAGFKVELLASGLKGPRLIRTAPNGDLFIAESYAGQIIVFHGDRMSVFATGLCQPFGIAFYPNGEDPQWIYVANTDSVVRFPYNNGDLTARAAATTVVEKLPSSSGHWTRDLAFSGDGKRMFVSVGSRSNAGDPRLYPSELNRANILEYTPNGKFVKVYAWGIPKPRRDRRQSRHRRIVVFDERARWVGRQSRAGLHNPRSGGRLLWLALVLHRPQSGSSP
jgi:glucose/arabinose dehydrogenase